MKKYLIFSNWKLVYPIAGFIFRCVHPFEPLSQPPLCCPVLATSPLRDALAFLICIFLFLCPVKWVTWLMIDWYVCLPALPVKSEVAPLFVCIPTVLGDKQREEGCLVPELLLVLPWCLRRHPSAACPISLTDVSTPLAELVGQDACPHQPGILPQVFIETQAGSNWKRQVWAGTSLAATETHAYSPVSIIPGERHCDATHGGRGGVVPAGRF